jgi:hypothetical protein
MTPRITNWRKSSRSGSQANCVEVGSADAVVGVRDSKDREGPMLLVSLAAWASFVSVVTGATGAR